MRGWVRINPTNVWIEKIFDNRRWPLNLHCPLIGIRPGLDLYSHCNYDNGDGHYTMASLCYACTSTKTAYFYSHHDIAHNLQQVQIWNIGIQNYRLRHIACMWVLNTSCVVTKMVSQTIQDLTKKSNETPRHFHDFLRLSTIAYM